MNDINDKLNDILTEIYSGERVNIDDLIFTEEELLSRVGEKTFLETLFELGLNLSMKALLKVNKNIDIAYLYCEHNRDLFFFKLSEEQLFSKKYGLTYLEFFARNHKLNNNMVAVIENHLEIIDILIKYNEPFYYIFLNKNIVDQLSRKNSEGLYNIEKYLYDFSSKNLVALIKDSNVIFDLCEKYDNKELFEELNEDIMMSKTKNGTLFIEYLLKDKNIIPNSFRNTKDVKFIHFIIENNLQEYLLNCFEDTLLLEINDNVTLFEYLIDNGHLKKIDFEITSKNLLKTLYSRKKLDLVKKCSESLLLKSVNDLFDGINLYNDVTLLEYMLDSGYNPIENNYIIFSEELFQILYKKHRPDLLLKLTISNSLKLAEEDVTYFDYILECIKNDKIKANIKQTFAIPDDINEMVKYYFIIAKHDMMEYIGELEDYMLLKKYEDKTLIEWMLDTDLGLTLDKILNDEAKANPKIAAILKSRGIVVNEIDILVGKQNFNAEYLEKENNTLEVGPLPYEAEVMLNQLLNWFLMDGRSDRNLIYVLINGYRRALFVNYELNIKELEQLSNVKRNNMQDFCYVLSENRACFNLSDGCVYCDDFIFDTLAHETGHALHYYLTNNKVPENYFNVVSNLRNNDASLKRIEEFVDKYNDVRKHVLSLVNKQSESFFESYYDETKKNNISDFLISEKLTKKEMFLDLGIPENQLDLILEEIFTEEEYINHQKRIFNEENFAAIFRTEFGMFSAVADIADAVYEGRLYSGTLKNSEGNFLKKIGGHGMNYYYETVHGFDEMVANFSSILKYRDSNKALRLLRDVVGEDLFNLLSNFYLENIMNIKNVEQKYDMTRGGK